MCGSSLQMYTDSNSPVKGGATNILI
eukprot:COSAG02_NODE_29128_length_575_cov_1.598739_1_plen_25_part_10